MDKTMKYYFIKKPKKLIKIYDQVLGILSEMESLAEKEGFIGTGTYQTSGQVKSLYSFPDSSEIDSPLFDITLKKPGNYRHLYFSVYRNSFPRRSVGQSPNNCIFMQLRQY